MLLLILPFNINFESGFELHCEMVVPDGYPFKPEFNLALVEFNNVSAGRTERGNMNYLTFMKNSKTLGKIISCKRLPQVNKKVQ